LPKLDAKDGEDLRSVILYNRIASDAAHDECAAKHKSVLSAFGQQIIQLKKED